MSRKTQLTAAVLAAVLLGAFLWLWIMSMSDDNTTPLAENESGEAEIAADEQTPAPPPNSPKAPPKTDAEPDTGPYSFKNWQEAADYFAELLVQEYDRLVEAGEEPPPYSSLALLAYNNVQKRIFEDKEDIALYNAITRYIPYTDSVPVEKRTEDRMPSGTLDPWKLLVRAGRLPPTELQSKMTLPNGETYYVDEKEEVYITWQKKQISPQQQQALARLETARAELESRLKQTPGDQRTRQKLDSILAAIEKMSVPQVKTYEAMLIKGLDPTHPDYKFTFLDMGDLGNAERESGDSK